MVITIASSASTTERSSKPNVGARRKNVAGQGGQRGPRGGSGLNASLKYSGPSSDQPEIRRSVISLAGVLESLVARFARLQEKAWEFIDSPEFHESGRSDLKLLDSRPAPVGSSETELLARLPFEASTPAPHRVSSSSDPGELGHLTRSGHLLTPTEELHLFRRLNYAKYLMAQGLQELAVKLDPQMGEYSSGLRQMDRSAQEQVEAKVARLEQLADVVSQTRDRLLECNLRLVVSIAKRFVDECSSLGELISDGNWTLLRAVEKFDYTQGNRFSTYATHAIQRAYFRSVAKRRTQRAGNASLADSGEKIEIVAREGDAGLARERNLHAGAQEIERLLGMLEPRERAVIESRFLAGTVKAPTFEKIGARLGVCKERVRQIQLKAFAKLRSLIGPQFTELYALESN